MLRLNLMLNLALLSTKRVILSMPRRLRLSSAILAMSWAGLLLF